MSIAPLPIWRPYVSTQMSAIWNLSTVHICNFYCRAMLPNSHNNSADYHYAMHTAGRMHRHTDSLFWEIIHSPPRGVSREWGRGMALYGAYAAGVNLTASPWKMLRLTVPPHGTEASSSLLRFEVRTAKEWRNACVEEPTARNLNWCSALVLGLTPQSTLKQLNPI